jgi:arginine-tRNA-protein transferase
MSPVSRIDECGLAEHVTGASMDALWSQGWRHQGKLFFRYSHCVMQGVEHDIIPLRIDLAQFQMRKSQRRVWRRNEDVRWIVEPAMLDDAMHTMFERHSSRFDENIPTCLQDFLGSEPAHTPGECLAVKALLGDELIAVSFMDVGEQAASSVYAIFEPDHAKRALGTLTLLKEIDLARSAGMNYLYHGYGTHAPGPYDYKKQFSPLEGYDWETWRWQEMKPD